MQPFFGDSCMKNLRQGPAGHPAAAAARRRIPKSNPPPDDGLAAVDQHIQRRHTLGTQIQHTAAALHTETV